MQPFGKTDRKIFSKHFRSLDAFVAIAVLGAGFCFSSYALADGDAGLREAAQRLAERVAAIPGVHTALRFQWHPDAAWSEGENIYWQEMLRSEFEKRSLSLTEDAGATALDVFAAETPTQTVLTAKTRVSDRDEVRIVAVARGLLAPESRPVAPVRLERQMIYESPDRVLDASPMGNGVDGGLVLLLYRNFEIVALRLDSKGAVKQNALLNSANLKPSRDPRAELTAMGNVVSVQLSGKVCEFLWESPDDVKCQAQKPAEAGKSQWRTETLLTSPCDGGDWKLLSSVSEPSTREVLQVLPDGASRESNAALLSEFPGPIVATNRDQNPGSALVIARNLRTGNYEVYKITLACGN